MSATSEIENAIGTHGLFKLRLRSAIASGRLEGSVATLGSHLNCPFGKWMTSPTVAPTTRASSQYAKVDLLHARFHLAAAKVAALATAGRAEEAKAALEPAGEFALASADFMAALQEWKGNIGALPRPSGRLSRPVLLAGIPAEL
jgi:methyl-accepting chemotaxis protein